MEQPSSIIEVTDIVYDFLELTVWNWHTAAWVAFILLMLGLTLWVIQKVRA